MTAKITTGVAVAGAREHLFMGRRVFGELTGNVSMSALLLLGLTGHLPSDEEVEVLDAIAASWSIADPRVWPLKVARLVASHGNTLSGVAAATLAMSCRFIGPWRNLPATAKLLIEIDEATRDCPDKFERVAGEIISRRKVVPGFGVAFRDADERLEPLTRCLVRSGRHELRYFALGKRLVPVVRKERRLEPNAATSVAAALLDLDVQVGQMGAVGSSLMVHMLFANAFEGAAQRSELLLRLPPEHIHYVGRPPRCSPRSMASSDFDSRPR